MYGRLPHPQVRHGEYCQGAKFGRSCFRVPQDKTYALAVIGECINEKFEEEIYSQEGIEFNGQFYCSCYCFGQHLVNEGQAVEIIITCVESRAIKNLFYIHS